MREAREVRDAICKNVPKTTVARLAQRGVNRVRFVDMGTLEKLFAIALGRALERSLARLPGPARQAFEREAREELRGLVRETAAAPPVEPPSERKQALLEIVFKENLVLQKRAA